MVSIGGGVVDEKELNVIIRLATKGIGDEENTYAIWAQKDGKAVGETEFAVGGVQSYEVAKKMKEKMGAAHVVSIPDWMVEDTSKLKREIEKTKQRLMAKARAKGLYENFGQREYRQLKDKYGNTKELDDFNNWAMNYTGRENSYSSGGLVRKTGFAKVHKGELVIPASTLKRVKRTKPHYLRYRKTDAERLNDETMSELTGETDYQYTRRASRLARNRGQGGYFRHRREHSINARKARRRRY